MVQAYFECFQNAAIAEREYISLYPNRRHYGGQVFARKPLEVFDDESFVEIILLAEKIMLLMSWRI